MLIAGLLITSVPAYFDEINCDIIELDDFQEVNSSCAQYPNYADFDGSEEQQDSGNEKVVQSKKGEF